MPIETSLNRRPPRLGLLVLLLALLPACGAGTAAVVAGSGDSGGGGTTPALDLFAVESPRVATSCQLRLDASAPVRVALFYDRGLGERALTTLDRVSGNELDLPAGEFVIGWNFASEPGIGTTGFTPDVRLMAKLGGSVIGGGELTLGLGNDAPEILALDQIDIDEDEEQASGTTGIELTIADSSQDVIDLKIEFDIQGDEPDAGWQLARPGLLEPGLPTPEFGVAGVRVASAGDGGTMVPFFWATDEPTDLKDLERDVQLRFTATDGHLTSSALFSPVFRVDNNEEPIVQLDSGPLILNPDERRGIPIPFRVIDEEGDLVEVIFQWRREGEEFPSLDTDGDGKVENAEVDAILADEVLRQQHHICSEYPHYAQGRVVPIDENTVRLPELASSESWILASGIVGKTLELLRPSSIPQPITPTWASNPLVFPVAALPIGDGLTALVLDFPGQARLREVELATGEVAREIATFGPGIPSTMAFERREKAVLVALDDAGTWRIERVELASGAVTELIVSDGTEPAPVRGIASLGESAAVFTAGSALLLVDYLEPLASRLSTLASDLATPWGVLADPLATNRIYLAERDADRILTFELDSHERLPVVSTGSPIALESPQAITLEDHATRLLVVTRTPAGSFQILGLELGRGENVAFPVGEPRTSESASLATGADGLRLAAVSTANELLVGGGLEQLHTIVAYMHFDAEGQTGQQASVDATFHPRGRPGQGWRIRPSSGCARVRAKSRDRSCGAAQSTAQQEEGRFCEAWHATTSSVLLPKARPRSASAARWALPRSRSAAAG
jgi:hypothetical protein